ncbi:hypothetical protein HF1_03800 [Mycoplasma haemofelis str. Langford 1]|uniref:Uncharacterized protein n=1 Tax=Mycoplasma haemofelis (strain Langford 1) TaxID=941640 RepID=E8ZGW7_MYCHL|nr:hypothetical protein [Mycoplasma haemofelis]CBY92388.1 hypothetical protein HF1_03800 [Mycoplasma haemofelis str. Langford 1]
MGKGAYLALGTAGAGGLGAGGLIASKPWQSTSKEVPKVVASIKDKYSVALLDPTKDETIWIKKYDVLKSSSPNNLTLQEALKKSKDPNKNEEEAKRLMKEGCKEIYESKIDDSKSFSDFRQLCSKNNEDASKAGDWNTDDVTTSNNKWDKALKKLKEHNIDTNDELDSLLVALKESIGANQTTTFDQALRTKVKDWCTNARGEMFEGENSIKFKNQETFCKVIS